MSPHKTDATAEKNNIRLSLIEYPVLIMFGALMIIVFLQFCTRYILNDSLAWTEEIARYLLVGIVFSGSLLLVQKGEHIMLEVTYRMSGRANTKPLALFSALVSLLYYGVLTIFAVLLAFDTGQSLISIPIPKALIYAFVAATLALSTWYVVKRLLKLRGQTSDEIYADIEASADQGA